MKKILSIILCLAILFSIAGCKKEESKDSRPIDEIMEDYVRDYGVELGLLELISEDYGSKYTNLNDYQIGYKVTSIKHDTKKGAYIAYGVYAVYETKYYDVEIGERKFELWFDETGEYIKGN